MPWLVRQLQQLALRQLCLDCSLGPSRRLHLAEQSQSHSTGSGKYERCRRTKKQHNLLIYVESQTIVLKPKLIRLISGHGAQTPDLRSCVSGTPVNISTTVSINRMNRIQQHRIEHNHVPVSHYNQTFSFTCTSCLFFLYYTFLINHHSNIYIYNCLNIAID